jgi:hypothetical protein
MEPGTVRQRTQAQAWLRFKGYEPTTLRLGPLTRLGGRISAANVASTIIRTRSASRTASRR